MRVGELVILSSGNGWRILFFFESIINLVSSRVPHSPHAMSKRNAENPKKKHFHGLVKWANRIVLRLGTGAKPFTMEGRLYNLFMEALARLQAQNAEIQKTLASMLERQGSSTAAPSSHQDGASSSPPDASHREGRGPTEQHARDHPPNGN